MSFVKSLVTWWHGQTLGTRLYTWRKGLKVGEDEAGNSYFETRDSARRWVIYNGEVEASKVPTDWHGWLHHTYKEPPTDKPLVRKAWETPHQPNLTGTAAAYAPAGSLRAGDSAAPRSDYEAWQPE